MGVSVSKQECLARFRVDINCNITFSDNNQTFESIGGFNRTEVPTDADIAGIGVLGVFIAVTSFALVISILDGLWISAKLLSLKKRDTEEQRRVKPKRRSVSDIMEGMIQTCSDQQLFTGAAYAVTLRYVRGCQILAYHYNIVSNMLLLTCATHLMSVIIVRNYWKYPWLAGLRIILITGVFLMTGLLLSNQDADADLKFPTSVPDRNTRDSPIFLPAACFQDDTSSLFDLAKQSVESGSTFQSTIFDSSPGNQVEGWNFYVLMTLVYSAALFVELIRFLRRARSRPGWRARFAERLRRTFPMRPWMRKAISILFVMYLIAGVVISGITVYSSARYIFDLRRWADGSGWLEQETMGRIQRMMLLRLDSWYRSS
ncbi:hypothetical protein F4778DRAFT_479093 [Xylariomycetidae sp. FL2044]|nr:hypothetical protein F4778DRAFT_479093 [Xylariomycetidae sp. FL2044]